MRTPISPATRRRLDALRRRREVRALARAAASLGAEAWIVGGAARDAALGRPVPEIDAAVRGDAEALAAALEAAGEGRSVFLSRDRPGPRVFRVAGRRTIDLAEVEGGSIGADLARRDFTVNALAMDLSTGEVLDPFGGLEDLARRRLACVRPSNLLEDPLRALRAARFIATHGFEPDRATLEAARAAAPALAKSAVERIATELARLLESPRAAPALAWAARAGLMPGALGVDLPPRRASALARSLGPLDDAATRRLSPERRRRLRMASLVSRLRLERRPARRWLGERRWSKHEAEEIALLADLTRRARRLRTRRDAWRWILDAGALGEDAVHLVARVTPSGRSGARLLSRLARTRRPRVRVSGGDVLRWSGLPPGPSIGELLRELEVSAAAGDVRNRREARNWLVGQVRKAQSPAIISAH